MPRGYASSEISERDYYATAPSSHHGRERERERDRGGHRGGGHVAEYDEVEIRERRHAPTEPEFLREDYGRRSEAGPLVVRERERERSRDRERPRRGEEREEVVMIERREKSRERPRRRKEEVVHEEEVVIEKPRRREREREIVEEDIIVPVLRRRERVEEEIVYRDEAPPPPRPVRTERENFEFYRREREEVESTPLAPRREPLSPPVRSEREVFEYHRPIIREPSPEPVREEIIIKEERRERERPRYREEREEEIVIKEKSHDRPRYREEEEEILIREKSHDRPRYREEEEIVIREREREREKPRYREERDTLTIRSDERPRARSRSGFEESDALVIRRTEGGGRSRGASRAASTRGDFREEEITIREREREREPPRRARSPSLDREEKITFRHDDRGGRHNDEIIIRRKERSPSPEPIREPEPIVRPPVVQEVITHHRHIDHGFERAPSPPRPRSPSPPPVRDERIEIRHRGTTSNGRRYDDDIIFERERGNRRELEGVHRGGDRYSSEEDYSISTGGAAGGGALIRISSEREAVGPPVRYEAREKERKDRLWTEITKDLVSEEAIREKGYEFEEAEGSYFVMQHLRYDDVLALTELTEDIRADRRDRISEIKAERTFGPPPALRRPLGREEHWDEERVIEREIIYEGGGGPGGHGGHGGGGGGRRPGGGGRGYR